MLLLGLHFNRMLFDCQNVTQTAYLRFVFWKVFWKCIYPKIAIWQYSWGWNTTKRSNPLINPFRPSLTARPSACHSWFLFVSSSLIRSVYCLFFTFCLQEHSITPCYWMGSLHVCVNMCSDAGRQAVIWVWVPVPVSVHAPCFYLPICLCMCVHMRLLECVSFMAAPDLRTSPTISRPPRPPPLADLGYCPAQSTLESSTSPALAF